MTWLNELTAGLPVPKIAMKIGDDEDEYAGTPFEPPETRRMERGRAWAASPAGRIGGRPPLSSGRRVIGSVIAV